MATDDLQILVTGQAAAPAGFLIPGNGQIKPKAMNAVFDGTNAAGDFTPALEIISDAGIVVARVAAATVTAGDKAEVTWAPFLEQPAVQSSPFLKGRQQLWEARPAQVIPSGAVTKVVFTGYTSAPGASAPLDVSTLPANPLTWVAFGDLSFTLTATWAAGNYDRYVEISAPNTLPGAGFSVLNRNRGSLSPDADIQVVTAQISGSPSIPTVVTFNVFQASGVNQNCATELVVMGFPYL